MNSKVTPEPVFSSRGNGKLMLTGEYAVLKGAKALSVPLKLGQSLDVYDTHQTGFTWEAYHTDGIWNTVSFNDRLIVTNCSNHFFARQLQKIIRVGLRMSALNVTSLQGKRVVTRMDFRPEWGLGSSSTLIHNLAAFFNINAYDLLKSTFKGSGYDIANASSSMPIFFMLVNEKPQRVEVNFAPDFSDRIYFVYTGRKQSSQSSIRGFHKKIVAPEDINQISTISTYLAICDELADFQELMTEHEALIGKIIDKTPVQKEHFSDFDGSIKSLGAWGGDFIMAVSNRPQSDVLNYFRSKELNVIFNYDDLVLYKPNTDCSG